MTALLVLVAALAGGAGMASATSGEYCTTDLGTGETACFATEQAMRAASDEQLYHLLTIYELPYFDGDSRAYYSTRPCTAAYDNETDSPKIDPTLGHLNNRVSSFDRGYCRVRFWDYNNYAGPTTPLGYQDCPHMATCWGSAGNWDNRAGSLRMT